MVVLVVSVNEVAVDVSVMNGLVRVGNMKLEVFGPTLEDDDEETGRDSLDSV